MHCPASRGLELAVSDCPQLATPPELNEPIEVLIQRIEMEKKTDVFHYILCMFFVVKFTKESIDRETVWQGNTIYPCVWITGVVMQFIPATLNF